MILNETAFKKASKRLSTELKTSVSSGQETLARVLGFRNADAALKAMKASAAPEPTQVELAPVDARWGGMSLKDSIAYILTESRFGSYEESAPRTKQAIFLTRPIMAALFHRGNVSGSSDIQTQEVVNAFSLESVELDAWCDLAEDSLAELSGVQHELRTYLETLPLYRRERYHDQRDETALAHTEVVLPLKMAALKGGLASGVRNTWTENAELFVERLMQPLIFLRDHHGLSLDEDVVCGYFELNKLEDLAWRAGEQYPDLEKSGLLEGLRKYVLHLPGYERKRFQNQREMTREKLGYITMQLTHMFGSVASKYGLTHVNRD